MIDVRINPVYTDGPGLEIENLTVATVVVKYWRGTTRLCGFARTPEGLRTICNRNRNAWSPCLELLPADWKRISSKYPGAIGAEVVAVEES